MKQFLNIIEDALCAYRFSKENGPILAFIEDQNIVISLLLNEIGTDEKGTTEYINFLAMIMKDT